MNNEETIPDEIEAPLPNEEAAGPIEDVDDTEVTSSLEDDFSELEDDIIRNDTIPETSRDTPGSNGAFPVGAFDTSKD